MVAYHCIRKNVEVQVSAQYVHLKATRDSVLKLNGSVSSSAARGNAVEPRIACVASNRAVWRPASLANHASLGKHRCPLAWPTTWLGCC